MYVRVCVSTRVKFWHGQLCFPPEFCPRTRQTATLRFELFCAACHLHCHGPVAMTHPVYRCVHTRALRPLQTGRRRPWARLRWTWGCRARCFRWCCTISPRPSSPSLVRTISQAQGPEMASTFACINFSLLCTNLHEHFALPSRAVLAKCSQTTLVSEVSRLVAG